MEALTNARGRFRRTFESYDFGATPSDSDLDATESALHSSALIEELMLLSSSTLTGVYHRTRDSGDGRLDELSSALQALLAARKERLVRELEERRRVELERK